MEQRSVDVAIIGAGTAGLAARGAVCDAGRSSLLIEAGPPGTTCARVGCMPSKLLIAAAKRAEAVRGAGLFGIEAREPRIDGPAVLARLRKERDRFVGSVLDKMQLIPERERLEGKARFLDGRHLEVEGRGRIEAGAIVIASGAEPVIPKPFRGLGDRLLTNESLFELKEPPKSLAVVGLGPLGLELGQALHRLGVRTTFLDQGEDLGGLGDSRVNRAARDILGAELALHLGVEVEVAGSDDSGVTLRWQGSGDGAEATFERVLLAVGRKPRLEGLALERSGLELDDHGTPHFDPLTRRCGQSSIFIAGDADHERPLLHEAAWEGRLAGRNAAGLPRIVREERPPAFSLVFSDPQIAVLGEADPDDAEILAGEVDFSDQGRARVEGHKAGLLRIYAEKRSGRLVGAAMIAPGAEHLATLLAWMMNSGRSASDLLAMPYYHPTLEEGLRTALQDLCSKLGSYEGRPEAALDEGPGG